MSTLSLELRERILASYDNEEGTRLQIAERYKVSDGMVKKLLQQRRNTGDIRPRHYNSGRKPVIVSAHRQRIRKLLSQKPDMTLKELRDQLELDCTIQTIFYVLDDMGLTYKKRRFEPVSKTGRT
jgi:transposase